MRDGCFSENYKGLKRQKGLTLVEVMLGLIIVSISILAVYYMFINGNTLIREQYHRRLALERARMWMEEMKYNQMELGEVPETFRGTFTDTLIAPGDNHEGLWAECTIDVEQSDAFIPGSIPPVPYYSEVSVVYRWQEPSEREYQIELRGIF